MTLESSVSGIVKSSLIVLVSSSVVITSPGLTRAPTLTRRSPTRPANGALMIVSLRRERANATRASLAFRVASICSSCCSDRTRVVYSSRLRLNWLRLSFSAASAIASSARASRPSSSTSVCPRRTCWPSWKRTAVTRFDTLAVTSTDSFARAVPSASASSVSRALRTGAATTASGVWLNDGARPPSAGRALAVPAGLAGVPARRPTPPVRAAHAARARAPQTRPGARRAQRQSALFSSCRTWHPMDRAPAGLAATKYLTETTLQTRRDGRRADRGKGDMSPFPFDRCRARRFRAPGRSRPKCLRKAAC